MAENHDTPSDQELRHYDATYFELSWIELETLKILERLNSSIYKGEMIELLKKKHPVLAKKPESSFYAIFEKLQEKGLVNFTRIEGKGYKTFFSITEEGKKELWKALSWALSTIMGKIISELVKVIRKECVLHLGCSKELYFGVISTNNPELNIGPLCNECVNATNENSYNRFNIILPYALNVPIEHYQNILAKPDNIPLKDNFLDRLLSVISLGLLGEEEGNDLIQEIYRTLKPGGKVAFYEVKKFNSYLFDALNEVTQGFSLIVPTSKGSIIRQFEVKELIEKIGKYFDEEKIKVVDLKEIVLIVAEK